MTVTEMLDSFKKFMNPPQEALDYLLGSSDDLTKIPTVNNAYYLSYTPRFMEELEDENAELAARCVRTIAAMKGPHAIGNSRDIPLLAKSGFTLEMLLALPLDDENLKNHMKLNAITLRAIAREILTCFGDRARDIVTAEFLKNAPQNLSPVCAKITAYTAAQIIAREDTPNKKLCDELWEYTKNYKDGSRVCLCADIFRKDKRFAETLKDELEYDKRAEELYIILDKNYDDIKAVFTELASEPLFIYYCTTGLFSSEHVFDYEQTLAEDPQLVTRMIKRLGGSDFAAYRHFAHMLLRLADRGVDIGGFIRDFEMYYPNLCGEIIGTGRIQMNMTTGELYEMLREEPQRAQSELRISGNCYVSGTYGGYVCRINIIFVLSVLFEYSEMARILLICLIKAAADAADSNNFLMSMILAFCMERKLAGVAEQTESLELLLQEGVEEQTLLRALNLMLIEYGDTAEPDDFILKFTKTHLDSTVKFYDSIKSSAAASLALARLILKRTDYREPEFLTALLQNKSKQVSMLAAETIEPLEQTVRGALEEALPKLKGDGRKRAAAIIKKWDDERRYGKDFSFTAQTAAEYVSENMDTKLVKKIDFIPRELFSGVRSSDLSENVPEEVFVYIFSQYMGLEKPYSISLCSKLAMTAYTPDLEALSDRIYSLWLNSGADNKQKNLLLPCMIFASDSRILEMKKQLEIWAKNSRSALAAFAVTAIALKGSPAALMMVDSIAAKFPNKQVKRAAAESFSVVAEALEISPEELADRIVPTLGLDKNGEAVLDYGQRSFTISLMPDFSIEITDNARQKKIKSLPKPTASDDEIKAGEAKKYLSELKKQLKTVAATQKLRLQSAFRTERRWSSEGWRKLFVENPIMRIFAKDLIWGVYDDSGLLSSFRYSDDGSFCDENDDEYILPDNADIALVHPIDLTEQSVQSWAEQLSDYEIHQPFAQIGARIVRLTEGDYGSEDFLLTKYMGSKTTVGRFAAAAKKYDLVRTTVGDGAGIGGYYVIDTALGVGLQMYTEFMYIGQDYDEEITLDYICFYKLPENDPTPDCYTKYTAIDPKTIKSRFISCCLEILEQI